MPARSIWLGRAGAVALLVLLAVPVITGIAETTYHLVGAPAPYSGWGAEDYLTVFTGHSLYQDPATGYTALLYTPLYFYVVGWLNKLVFWAPWAMVVTAAWSIAACAAIGAVAFRARSRSWVDVLFAAVGAVVMAAAAWYFIAAIFYNQLYTNLPDHMAWALSVFGLLALSVVRSRPRWALLVGIPLLVAALWTKQPAVTAGVAGGAWLVLLWATGQVDRKVVLWVIARYGAPNLGVL